jgi:TPR repeat protein
LFLGVVLREFKKENLAGKKFLKSCHLGNARGCLFLGNWYQRRKKVKNGLKFFYKSCRMDHAKACRVLSLFFEQKKSHLSYPFAHHACYTGNSLSCLEWGLKQFSYGSQQRGLKFLHRSCDLTNSHGCLHLGKFLRHKYSNQALKYFTKGCNLGNLASCLELQKNYDNSPEKKKTYSMYACQLGEDNSCFDWGKWVINNDDISMGQNILRNSCERGHISSCSFLKAL